LELKAKKDVWTEQTDGEVSIDIVIEPAKKLRKSTGGNRIEVLDIEGRIEHRFNYSVPTQLITS
jgi:hypothetical protein